jgi:tetratricopeptide (TPR) repeat protein
MVRCPSADLLGRLLDDRLTETERRTVGEHVRGCAACQDRLNRLSEDSVLRGWGAKARCRPPAEVGLERVLAALKAGAPPPTASTAATVVAPPPDDGATELPRFLGPYTLVEELGRGGMGIVFRALDPSLGRTVAVKVLRPELADEEARARVLREARAAARFRHEHAVVVHAVDHTRDGLPYLVMEHVAGPTLARLVRERQRLEPALAVAVVAQVADALAAAHAAGLVHRDVKPCNVLLEADGAGGFRAKLADFGLARDAAEVTALTREGHLAGTPAYMSPEQVRGEPLDGRGDVYSLGATLYEALTGEPPFRGTPHLVVRQVLHDEPRPPRRLNDAVPPDLETVCLKALEKEPGRRYATAADFAADLRRWQRGEPTAARPAGRAGRLWRWAKRNPRVAALAAALALAVAGGTGGVLWQWSRAVAERDAAQHERDEADAQRRRAVEEFRRERLTVDAFLTDVSDDPELKARNLEPLRRKLLQRARDNYERFVAEHPDDPDLLADLGRAHARLGDIVGVLDSQPRALEHFQKAQEIFDRLRREHPDEASYRVEAADVLNRLGVAHAAAGQAPLAEEDLRGARELWEGLVAERPDDPEPVYRLLLTLNNLGRTRHNRGDRDGPEEPYGAARAAYARWAERHPPEPRHRSALSFLLANLGLLYRQTGRPDLEAAVLKESLGLAEQLVRDHPEVDQYREALLHAANENGIRHALRGEADEAEAAWKQAETAAEELARRHPGADGYQEQLATTACNRGLLAHSRRRADDGLSHYRRALAIRERLVGDYPQVMPYAIGLHQTCVGLAALLRDVNQSSAAVEVYDRALRCWVAAHPPDGPDANFAGVLGALHIDRAQMLSQMKRHAEALPDYDEAIRLAADDRKPPLRVERTAVAGYDRAAKGDHAAAAGLGQSVADQSSGNGYGLYLAATVLARAAAAVAADAHIPLPRREQLADQYAARAVGMLRRAQAAGRFADPARSASLATDEYLAPLRPRDDFKQLLADLKAAPR